MEEILRELEEFPSETYVYPAERIILSKLMEIKKEITKKLETQGINRIISILVKLLSVNEGNLSVQCSSRIGDLIYSICNANSHTQYLTTIIKSLIKHPTSATICATGRILTLLDLGKCPLVDSYVSMLIKQPFKHVFPVMQEIAELIGDDCNIIREFIEPVYSIAKNAVLNGNESVQLMAEIVILRISTSGIIKSSEIFNTVNTIFNKKSSVFVYENACRIVGRFFSQYIDPENEKETMNTALKRITKFSQYKEIIFLHFFSLLSSGTINRMHDVLAKFIFNNMQSFMRMFMNSLTKSSKTKVLKSLEEKDEKRVYLLNNINILDYDDINFDIAKLAYDVSVSNNEIKMEKGTSFFFTLYSKNRQLSLQFLRSSLEFLADPQCNADVVKHIKANAIIAANIISSIDAKEEVVKRFKTLISEFLNRALNAEHIICSEFSSAFILMSALPADFIPGNEVCAALKRFRSFFKESSNLSHEMKSEYSFLSSSVSVFIAAHPDIKKTAKTLELLLTDHYLVSPITKLATFLSYPYLQTSTTMLCSLSSMIRSFISTISPTIDYVRYKVKFPMYGRNELLHGGIFSPPKFSSAFIYEKKENIAIRIVENYPKYILRIPSDSVDEELSFLFNDDTNKLISTLLINSLLTQDVTARLLPQKTLMYLLNQLNTHFGATQMQLLSETIAMWTSFNPNSVKTVISFVSDWKNRVKCLLYSSLFSYAPLSDEEVLFIMLELNNLAKAENICAFALFSLSVLYKTHFSDENCLKFADTQCVFLFDIIHSDFSHDSFNLFYMSQAYISLLPAISSELKTTQKGIIPILALTLQSFVDTRISFSRQVACISTRTASQYISNMFDYINIQFPDTKFKTIAEKLNTYGVFSALLNFGVVKSSYIPFVSDALLVLQMTGDCRAYDFIISIAHQLDFVDPDSNQTYSLLNEWNEIIKDVLENSLFTVSSENVPIFASHTTKKCILEVARNFIKVVKRSTNQLKKESWLKSLIHSILKPIIGQEQHIFTDAFNVLTLIIESKLADSYEEELSIAAEKGFSAFDQCGDYHAKFIDFIAPKLASNEEKHLVAFSSFVNGINKIDFVSKSFLIVAAKLLSLSKSSDTILDAMKPCLNKLVDILANEISEVMEIMNKCYTVNKEIEGLSNSWNGALSGFVWLETLTEVVLAPETIISFCSNEIKRCNQKWRIKAAFECLRTTMRLMEVENNLIEDVSKKLNEFQLEKHNENEEEDIENILEFINNRKITL